MSNSLASVFPDVRQTVRAVQTDSLTEELGVNTEPDWERQVEAMLEDSSRMSERYNGMMKKQEEQELDHEKHLQQLQKKKEEATRQYKVRTPRRV